MDETIAERRANHDRLRAVVEGLTDDQLSAQIGSGAEIARCSLLTALGDDASASGDRPTNQDVWDRWNALRPRSGERVPRERRPARGAGDEAADKVVRHDTGSMAFVLGFTGKAVVRLMAGRLRPENTPAGIEVTGNVTLDELRRVFPGC